MTTFIHHKAALAAACLSLAAGLAFAQNNPTPSNTTSPDPLQVNPVDGTPNSANGKLTPGTGTGSSRTMRSKDNAVAVDPANTNRSTGSPDPQMNHPAATGGSSTTGSNANKGTMRSGDSMDSIDAPGAGTGTRAARRDRG